MAKELSFVVSDPVGLHARPATILVNQASKFTSNIKYKAGTTDLTNAKSVASGEFYVNLEQFKGFTVALPKNTEDNYTLEVGGTIDLGVIASIAKVIKEQKVAE